MSMVVSLEIGQLVKQNRVTPVCKTEFAFYTQGH